MKVYKIPSNEYTSYLVVDAQNVILYHSGNVKDIKGSREQLLGGSELITTTDGLNFIIPSDIINYSFPPSLSDKSTVLIREYNPTVIRVVLQAVKSNDPNALKFMPSPTFRGRRPGYIFTTRNDKTGYYLDKIELAKQAGQIIEPKCENGVCSISDQKINSIGKMFSSNKKEPTCWSATGEPLYENPATNDFAGREAVLYRHQLAQNERALGPDTLPMQFQ